MQDFFGPISAQMALLLRQNITFVGKNMYIWVLKITTAKSLVSTCASHGRKTASCSKPLRSNWVSVVRTLRNIESGAGDMDVKILFKAAELYKTSVSKLLNLGEIAIVNSFNSEQEQTNCMNLVHSTGTNLPMDKTWLDEMNKRFAFLEQLVLGLQAELKEARQK